MISYFFSILFLQFLFFCTPSKEPILRFSVSETAGMPREIDFVEIKVTVDPSTDVSHGFAIKESDHDTMIRGQILDSMLQVSGKTTYTCLFPVSIAPNTTKNYEIMSGIGMPHEEVITSSGRGFNIKIENSYYIADLTDIKATPTNGLGSGQLAGLVLKGFNNTLLERSHINMHWAPNFQKEGLEYKTFGHILEPDTTNIIKGPYAIYLYKSGYVEGYEGIRVTSQYQFYAGQPYFLFSSEIKMDDDIELWLLRNDEMTMDSLFTHVIFPAPDGELQSIELYDLKAMEALAEEPIKDDASWLGFYHKDLNYGFGSIRLAYDNTSLQGLISPLFGEHTKITPSANNGRYWNRRLVNDQNMMIPSGSRYIEKNAYLIFNTGQGDPSGQILEYQKLLSNPLKIQYDANQ
jgi:hypothetical protein